MCIVRGEYSGILQIPFQVVSLPLTEVPWWCLLSWIFNQISCAKGREHTCPYLSLHRSGFLTSFLAQVNQNYSKTFFGFFHLPLSCQLLLLMDACYSTVLHLDKCCRCVEDPWEFTLQMGGKLVAKFQILDTKFVRATLPPSTLFADKVLLCRGYSISEPNTLVETVSKYKGLH